MRYLVVAVAVLCGVAGSAHAAQLYWADYANNRIQRANLDGSGVQTVLGNLPGITALAVDDVHGTIYWSETAGGHRIRRANLDGSNVTTLLDSPEMIYDIALDVASNRMFFGQGGGEALLPLLRGATLNGGSPFTVVGPKNGNEANYTPYAVGVYGGRLYFPGNSGNIIRRVNYDGTGDEIYVQDAGGGTFAFHFRPDGSLFWVDEDDDYLRSREHGFGFFNMRSDGGPLLGERWPWGLASDGERFFWSDAYTHEIRSVDLFGDGYSAFAVEGEPRRIALVVPEPAGAIVAVLFGCLVVCRRSRDCHTA